MWSSRLLRTAAAVTLMAGAMGAATAQVTYNRDPNVPNSVDPLSPLLPFSDPSSYDQAFDVVPSYQIRTDPYAGGPAVRVVAHCLFPNGWNVTDFSRSINGIPAGVDHQCPADAAAIAGRVRARY